MSDIDRLDVSVDRVPEPGLIRAAVEAVLAGRATAPGPEQAIAGAVHKAITVRAAEPVAASQASPNRSEAS